MQKTTVRQLFVIAGSICVATGIIGIFVPILPTTPFLLLAAVCYARGSDRLHKWLLNNRLFGSYIRSYIEGRGMPLRIKLFTILLLWTGIGLTIALGPQYLALIIALAIIAVGVTVHISLIKPKKTGDNQ